MPLRLFDLTLCLSTRSPSYLQQVDLSTMCAAKHQRLLLISFPMPQSLLHSLLPALTLDSPSSLELNIAYYLPKARPATL